MSSANDNVIEAIVEYVRSGLSHREPVVLPGLGTFEVVHQPSRVEIRDDGSRIVHPPKDAITFTPEA